MSLNFADFILTGFILITHIGYSDLIPENTIPAF